ncbi:arylsulfatase A-like enzyme [Arenibacter algicola]|uniref:Arylsulfatase A-like enzyme n=1 Tax=Arenibacter algicola TaxID=616991 RepID=A0ABY3AKR0_9FLAO
MGETFLQKSSNLVFVFCWLFTASLFLGCADERKKSETSPEENPTPNIILLMADDQGWGDMAYNGHPHLKTPNLDAMAANGAVFERFYSASAVCSPTRGSVMTGRHPLRYGICHANCGHIKPEEITLGEMVKDLGYTTGHFGKWHLGTLTRDIVEANRGGREKFDGDYAPPWDHGFDVSFVTESKVPTWDPMVTPPQSSGDVNGNLIEGEPFNTSYWTGPGKIAKENLEGDDSRVIMDRAIPFIENAAKNDKPFLSIIWFHTPHLPVLAGDDDRAPYADLSEDQQHYYGVLTALDKQVGRLRDKLRELGIAENTVLFYTSDNGPEGKSVTGRTQGLTKGLTGRKRSLNEGGIRVPGIMEWEGKIGLGTKVNIPCFTSDYFPTIANILGVDLKKNNRPYDGVDMLPIVNGEVMRRTEPLAFDFQGQAALIDNEYKIYSDDGGQHFALYNIRNDMSESNNLATVQPEKLNEMVAYWNQWKESQLMSASGKDY